MVKKGTLYGYIGTKGEEVTNIRFQRAYGFSEGRAKIAVMGAAGLSFGYIDETGAYAVEPVYSEARTFREGYAAVKNISDRWGYVDRNGETVIPMDFDEAFDFTEGIARVRRGKKYGFIKITETEG